MKITRYVSVTAYLTNDNKLVPIWDSKLQFTEADFYSASVSHPDYFCSLRPVAAVYDLVEKKLSLGEPIEIFDTDTTYTIGENVYVEHGYHVLKESTIVDIQRGTLELRVEKGSEVNSYHKGFIDNFNPNTMYALYIYSPKYIMADGTEVEYNHELYKKAE